jgi:hypothetical protein
VDGSRKLHNKELHKLHAPRNIIGITKSRRMKLVGCVSHMGKIRNSCKCFVRKPEGKRPCRRHRNRWEDNVTLYHREIDWEVPDWKHLAQDRDQWWALVKTVMNLHVQ